ncbi:hypothetical protein B0H21DRAFT_710236 [Amylocystis lapponica]|nr:hypothetical protein B0H21DRAFT_710236 [Amylocystis lapponica]
MRPRVTLRFSALDAVTPDPTDRHLVVAVTLDMHVGEDQSEACSYGPPAVPRGLLEASAKNVCAHTTVLRLLTAELYPLKARVNGTKTEVTEPGAGDKRWRWCILVLLPTIEIYISFASGHPGPGAAFTAPWNYPSSKAPLISVEPGLVVVTFALSGENYAKKAAEVCLGSEHVPSWIVSAASDNFYMCDVPHGTVCGVSGENMRFQKGVLKSE